ncbi:hypothetical protein [Stenotrophomonas sp. NA06056]|uniref:hypothetical protein n=1 Tax=Stenotrophomonas sp. NA06056 TaxID=2742129 RepID=UPI00158B3E65|nr:hypothetical protein [Stenotrophomonas sp. NA06056]QKW56398.1 hypothetical protein HUT07_07110 [Stenotrophomonas sp. NA06056]
MRAPLGGQLALAVEAFSAGIHDARTDRIAERAWGRLRRSAHWWQVCRETLEQLKYVEGIEELEIPYSVSVEDPRAQGTTITLSRDKRTLEADLHKAMGHNLWIFGPEFTLFSSNTTLKRIIEEFLDKKYAGRSTSDRPDLMLQQNFFGEYLLIEFKRPSHALTIGDYQQATGYRHHLVPFTPKRIRVFVIGGDRGEFPTAHLEPDVVGTSFLDVISMARTQLEWKLK